MFELFLSECRRFRTAALLFAGAHLLALLVLVRFADILNTYWFVQTAVLAVYLLAGAAFGLYQFNTLRQHGRWIWLLHRPLPRSRIFLAVTAAAAALLLLAVALPVSLVVGGLDLLTARVIDTRTYLTVLHLVLLVFIAWAAACHVVLFRNRFGVAIVFLPWLLLGRMAPLPVLLPLAALCTALLLFIAYGSFRPDRQAEPAALPVRLAQALPLPLAAYFCLLWAGTALFQLGLTAFDAHPLNMADPPAGGHTEVLSAKMPAVFRLGLAASNDSAAAALADEVRKSVPFQMWVDDTPFPMRYQWGNPAKAAWSDDENRIDWTFNHDAMRYLGRDERTGRSRGVLGTAGSAAFDAPPVPYSQRSFAINRLMSGQRLYRIGNDGAAYSMIALKGDERMITMAEETRHGVYVVTSSGSLLVFEPPAREAPNAPLRLRHSIALPPPAAGLSRLAVAELPGGLLVSALYTRGLLQGSGQARQVVLQVGADGHAHTVAQRDLAHDFSPLFEFKDWWLSPLLHELVGLRRHLLPADAETDIVHAERPRAVRLAAALCALLAACGAAWHLRRVPLPGTRKAAWIAACLVLGPPSLAALLVLHRRAARQEDALTPAAAPA